MSNLDLDIRKIPLPMTSGYQVIYHHSINKKEKELIVMIAIDEKEEKSLDNGFLQTVKENQTFTINSSDIICYGEIDFNSSSEDYSVVEDMKWLDSLDVKGLCIPADYNYKEHCCYSPIRKIRYTETFNPAVVSQYFHGRLGKPQRCCIFREKRRLW